MKFAIRFRYLTDMSSLADLAEAYGISTYQISKVLDGPEYQAMKEQLQKVQVQQAQDKLGALQETAVQSWAKAMPIAAAQGKHQAARDLLLATGAVKPSLANPTPQITVNIGLDAQTLSITLGGPAGPTPKQLPEATPAPKVIDIPAEPSTE